MAEKTKKTVNIKEFVADAISKAIDSDEFNDKLREAVEGIVFEILSEQDADAFGGGGEGGGEGGGGGVDKNELRRVVAELVEEATGGLDATGVSAPDPEAIRAVVQEELANADLGGGGGGGEVDPAEVQKIVAGVLKEEAPRLVARVKKSVAGLVQGGGGGAEGGADEGRVNELIEAAFSERLPASGLDNFVSRAEVSQIIAEIAPDGDGGGGGGDGLSVSHAKALVKDMLEAYAPTREEVDKMISRAGGGGGEGGGGGLGADDVRSLVGEVVAEMGLGEGGGGGGDSLDAAQVRALALEVFAENGGLSGDGGDGGGGEPALSVDMIRAAIADEVAKAGGGGGGGGGGDGTGVIDPQAFLNTDAMKEALDDRFRLMQTFIKQELVPKLVKKELKNQD